MGRINHASFRVKSSLQLIKKKTRIMTIREAFEKRNENEKEEQPWPKEKKVWKKLWCKWLGLIRGLRKAQETFDPDANQTSEPSKSLKSNSPGVEVIEIPIEPGQKISKILIKPTKTGIKAVIAQRLSPPRTFPRTPPHRDQTSDDEDARWVARALGQSDGRFSDDDDNLSRESISWTKTPFRNEREADETPLTSALFIRENMNNVVESAVFIEPTLPSDYVDLSKSDDFSQKSTRLTKRSLSHILDDSTTDDEFRDAVKTISEPSWFERKNIFSRRQLQDDINDLLEQFLFLESYSESEVLGLAVPRLSGSIHFDAASCFGKVKHSDKEICRNVSPEILVNIKPFKEYLSDDYLEDGTPSAGDRSHGYKNYRRSSINQVLTAEKRRTDPDTVRRAKECIYSLNGICVCNEKCLKNHCEYKSVLRFPCGTGREMRKPRIGQSESSGSASSLKELVQVQGTCRSYGGDPERPSEETELKKKNSLDELLLETLDDSDHDAVFQRNISQFKKKINVVPRLDIKKSVCGVLDARKRKYKKTKKLRNYFEIVQPIIECVKEESGEEKDSEEPWQRQRTEVLCVRSMGEWEGERMICKTLLTNVMLLSERNLVRRALATRMEEVMVNVLATWREMHSIVESGRCAMVQKKRTGRCEERLGVKLVWELARERNVGAVSKILGAQSEDYNLVLATDVAVLEQAIPQAYTFNLSTNQFIYIVNNFSFISYEEIISGNHDSNTLMEESSGSSSENVKKKRERAANESRVVFIEPVFGQTTGIVEIFGNLTFEYLIKVCSGERTCLCRRTSSEKHSNPVHTEKCAKMNLQHSIFDDASVRGLEATINLKKPKSFHIDGFQILYNGKDVLKDDTEDAMRMESAKSLEGIQENVSYTAGDSEKVKEKGEKRKNFVIEKKHSDESAEKKPNRFLRYKSSSSPRENIVQSEFGPQEHRMRRSLNFPKEFEKDFQNCKKRRLSWDKGLEFRRTGSALLDSHSPKAGQERSFAQGTSFGGERKFTTSVLSNEVKSKLGLAKQRMSLSSYSSRVNMRKEVVAAFNSIKEMNAGRGEVKSGNKRMSLVIMLCKKLC